RLHDIHRGDVVVFERPPGEPDTSIKDLIKRVIGLSGDTVEGRDCEVLVNGQALVEPYTDGKCTSTFGPVNVPTGEIFVMGDNRPASQDSRVFGPIDEDLVVGRAFVIIWPIGRWGWL
ncbi:MAG TPA: signal peptidase I, partial [Acidimicrobiales bacterium]